MKRSEIIHLLKQPIYEVMETYGKDRIDPQFASRTLAYTIFLHENGLGSEIDIRDKNNPAAIRNPSTGETNSYTTLKEGLIQYNEIGSVVEGFDDAYESLCKANNLHKIDKEFLAKLKGSVIDLTEEQMRPSVDVYTVKTEDGEITETSNLEEARKMKTNSNKTATIYDSKNRIIDGVKKPTKSDKIICTQLKAGAVVNCNNLNMYYRLRDTRPGRIVNGQYYLYDGKEINGRYAICLKPDLVNGPKTSILGYINVKDINK